MKYRLRAEAAIVPGTKDLVTVHWSSVPWTGAASAPSSDFSRLPEALSGLGGREDPVGDVIGAIIVIDGVIYGLMHGPKGQTCTREDETSNSPDVPSWVTLTLQIDPLKKNETCQQMAKRLLDKKYGAGKWGKGGQKEFTKIVKWCMRDEKHRPGG